METFYMFEYECPYCKSKNSIQEVKKGVDIHINICAVTQEGITAAGGETVEEDASTSFYQCGVCKTKIAENAKELFYKCCENSVEKWAEACGIVSEDLDEIVNALKLKEASKINNNGISEQISYIQSRCKSAKKLIAQELDLTEVEGPVVKCINCLQWRFKSKCKELDGAFICLYGQCGNHN